MTEIAQLPKGWVLTKLGDVLEPSKEKADPTKETNARYIGLEHIEKETGKVLEFGKSADVRSLKNRFHRGDLLYGKLRPYLNKVHLAEFDGICSTDIIVFSSRPWLSNKFMLYRFLSADFVKYANQNMRGVQHPRVDLSSIARFESGLPPIREQNRIALKVEELFSFLDAGVDSLRKIQHQLKRYNQAMLKYAFEGKLTEKWRKNQKIKAKPSEDPSLPDGWFTGRLENHVYIAGRIGWRGLKADEYTPEGPLFLSVYNLNKGDIVDLSETYHINEERYAESPEIQLRNNDILLAKDGAGIGKVGIVQGLSVKATVNSSLLVVRSGEVLKPKFLFYFFKGPKMQDLARTRITGSATPHLFQRDIKKFDLLIPPLSEQEQIIAEIESRLTIADQTKATMNMCIRQAEKLRQRILGDAFLGKLVSQDPSDEPATKLLEQTRINKEYNQTAKTSKEDKNTNQEELFHYVK